MEQDQMTLDEKKAEFIAFCIEIYKMKLGKVPGAKVAEYFVTTEPSIFFWIIMTCCTPWGVNSSSLKLNDI